MKNKEILSLSDVELTDKIKEEKEKLGKTTLNHSISPVEKPSEIRTSRRNIARLITEVNNRSKIANKKNAAEKVK